VQLNATDGLVVVSAFLPVVVHRDETSAVPKWTADWDYEALLSMQTHLRVTRVGVVKWKGWHGNYSTQNTTSSSNNNNNNNNNNNINGVDTINDNYEMESCCVPSETKIEVEWKNRVERIKVASTYCWYRMYHATLSPSTTIKLEHC